MSDHPLDGALSRETISALADGEAGGAAAASACQAWRHDADLRATWHAYHLIGDAMRSPELADAGDSERFLQKLRGRLAEEPVVLAPQAAQQVRSDAQSAVSHMPAHSPDAPHSHTRQPSLTAAEPLRRRMWVGPAAVAASFALVIGALTSNLGVQPGAAGDAQLARSGVGWAEGSVDTQGVSGMSLASGPSFEAGRRPQPTWVLQDPRVEQAMTVQRPLPAAPDTFSERRGLARQAVFVSP